MNDRLKEVYERAFPDLLALLQSNDQISWPLLMKVPAAYAAARIKLMVVGQETKGWGPKPRRLPDSVEDVISEYDRFELGKKYRKTPFWAAVHELYRQLNPDGPDGGFLWSNLIKVSQNRTRPTATVADEVCKRPLLQAEIRITEPTVVVFFTGKTKYYSERLCAAFPGMSLHPVAPLVSRIVHEGLPFHVYRTAHPNWLRRKRKWAALNDIAALVNDTAARNEPALLSELALTADWNRPGEDAAWSTLQPAKK